LNSYFLKELDRKLNLRLTNNLLFPRIVILGVGNEFSGDDAAGILVLRHLRQSISDSKNIHLIEASVAPENFTGEIRRYSPDWVWIIDAADMRLGPGEIRILDVNQIDGVSALTHQMPLTLFVKYIQMAIGSDVLFFGIQPQKIAAYQDVSSEIKTICEEFADELRNWIQLNII